MEPPPPPISSCDPRGGVTVSAQQPEVKQRGLSVQNENRANVHTAEQVNPCRVTCSPATSLFLSTARASDVSAVGSHSNPAASLKSFSKSWGSSLDFWFRHRAGFLWCLHPAVGNSLSPPDSTLLNVCTILSRSVFPPSLLTCNNSIWPFVGTIFFFSPFHFFFFLITI